MMLLLGAVLTITNTTFAADHSGKKKCCKKTECCKKNTCCNDNKNCCSEDTSCCKDGNCQMETGKGTTNTNSNKDKEESCHSSKLNESSKKVCCK